MNNLSYSRSLHALATARRPKVKRVPEQSKQRPYLNLLSAVLGRPAEDVVKIPPKATHSGRS